MARPSAPLPVSTLVRALPALTVLLAITYAVAAYFMLLSPLLSKLVAGGSLDVSGARADADAIDTYAKGLDASLGGYKKLEQERKDRVAAMVTRDPAIQDIIVQTDAIASKHDFVLTAIDAVQEEKKSSAGWRAIRVSAGLSGGTYAQFKAFLSELENAMRLSDVQNIVFTPGSGSFSLTFRAYFIDTAKL